MRTNLASRTLGDKKNSTGGQNSEHDLCHPHPKEEAQTRTLRHICRRACRPKFNPWSACPITFDHGDHPTSIRHGGSATLVLDHLTQVLMDGDSSLNLIYKDTIRNMGIDPSRINQSNTTFKGVIPCVEARCMGSSRL